MTQSKLKSPATPEEEALARKIISLIDRRNLPTFQRAGNQQYTELDPPKDPFTDSIDGRLVEGKDYVIITDGAFSWQMAHNAADGTNHRPYIITGYNYIIYRRTILAPNGRLQEMKQQVTCKSYRVKIFCQELIGLPVG